MSRIILSEGVGAGLTLGACTVMLAVLGLTPRLSWIPEIPLLGAAILVPVLVCGLSGFRAGRRRRRLLAGALAGGVAGAIGGTVGGLSYVLYGKPPANVAVGLFLGATGGAIAGAAGALLSRRASRARVWPT